MWEWKLGCPCGVFCPSPSPPNTYSYVGKENSDSTRKFVRNYLNWRMKYLNTSTTIRKILIPKKLLSRVCKYVKPKPISRQNQKLTQQHNWKKSSSSPCKASVCAWVSPSVSLWGSFWQENFRYLAEKGTSPTDSPQPDFFTLKLMTMASAGAICGK